MSLRLVNGYVCRNCADEELAKKGIDPAHPKQQPSKPGDATGTAKTSERGVNEPARPGEASTSAATKPELGVNAPAEAGALGTRLNLYA